MPKIVDGINQINDGLLLFQYDLNDKITCSLVTSDTKICDQDYFLQPNSFLTGDLSFLSTIVGKENYDTC